LILKEKKGKIKFQTSNYKDYMNFKEYQEESRKTAIYPKLGQNYVYPVLGLSGETGEVAEKFKKIIRDKDGIISDEDKLEIAKELGDVIWYLSQICTELGLSFESIAENNLKKLKDRQNRNTLKGNGGNR
jgi:NTP pyrophosphatase (non-canonical NTP hydrolase)